MIFCLTELCVILSIFRWTTHFLFVRLELSSAIIVLDHVADQHNYRYLIHMYMSIKFQRKVNRWSTNANYPPPCDEKVPILTFYSVISPTLDWRSVISTEKSVLRNDHMGENKTIDIVNIDYWKPDFRHGYWMIHRRYSANIYNSWLISYRYGHGWYLGQHQQKLHLYIGWLSVDSQSTCWLQVSRLQIK